VGMGAKATESRTVFALVRSTGCLPFDAAATGRADGVSREVRERSHDAPRPFPGERRAR
jgi:hypothetical protein